MKTGLKLFCNFSNGLIHDFGDDATLSSRYSTSDFDNVVDVSGMSIVPGLIDAHTHPVWDGDRVHEFAMKVRFVDSTFYFFEFFPKKYLKDEDASAKEKNIFLPLLIFKPAKIPTKLM